jgi:hypothetical protein
MVVDLFDHDRRLLRRIDRVMERAEVQDPTRAEAVRGRAGHDVELLRRGDPEGIEGETLVAFALSGLPRCEGEE